MLQKNFMIAQKRFIYFNSESPESRIEKRQAEIIPDKKANSVRSAIIQLAALKAREKVKPEQNKEVINLKTDANRKLSSALDNFDHLPDSKKNSAHLAKISGDYMKDWWNNNLNLNQRSLLVASNAEIYEQSNCYSGDLRLTVIVSFRSEGPKIDLAVG